MNKSEKHMKYSPRSSDSKRCDCAIPILRHQYRKLAALSRAKNDPGVASARQWITRRINGYETKEQILFLQNVLCAHFNIIQSIIF